MNVGDDQRYAAVVARRLQWDNLLWQVPVMSFTAQAFLFTIALGGGTSRAGRIISSVLSLVITWLSVTLMARHRHAELTDAEWLEEAERGPGGNGEAIHGKAFQQRRDLISRVGQGPISNAIPLRPGFSTWVGGLLIFAAAAICVLVLSVVSPSTLA
jgi:hypothetical protein